MGILWTILIGFIAGVQARLIAPGDNEPSGFILTTILGIVGAWRELQAACMVFLADIGGTAMSELIRSDATGFVVGSLMALLYFGTIVLMLLFLS